MTRQQFLENIIIGTLLESNWRKNYFDDCRCVLTADMFSNETNRRIFDIVSEMNKNGKTETDPCTICQEYGDKVLDILPQMLDLVTDYSFIHLKMQFNERKFLNSCVSGKDYERTDVQFNDYVRQFITNIYCNEKNRN